MIRLATFISCLAFTSALAPGAVAEVLFSGDSRFGLVLNRIDPTTEIMQPGWRLQHRTRFDLGLVRQTDSGASFAFTIRFSDEAPGQIVPGALHLHLPRR